MEEFDYLSMLPLEVRAKMLSLLPTQSAGRTCVLSKGWEDSWKLINSLHIDDENPLLQIDHVNMVLEALGPISFEKLHLHITRTFSSPTRLWIDAAISHHISEIDINVHNLELPSAFFTCGTLTKLKMRLARWVPEFWDQPLWDPQLVICLPNLRLLDTSAQHGISHNVFRLIQGSPSLKSVSLTACGYIPMLPPLRKLPNLRRLEFKGTIDDGLVTLFYLLDCFPSLEHLSVGELLYSNWNVGLVSVSPICLVERIRYLEFTNFGRMGGPEFHFLRYVLLKAKGLKKLSISCVDAQNVSFLQNDLEFLPKISKELEVEVF